MGVQYLGYRPVTKLDTPADIKLLNDTLRALWVKIMGNLTARDMTSDAQNIVADAFGQQLNAIDAQLRQISQLNAEQNGRLLALEERSAALQEALDSLDARVAALEAANT